MIYLDKEKLLKECSADNPCGENLECDTAHAKQPEYTNEEIHEIFS